MPEKNVLSSLIGVTAPLLSVPTKDTKSLTWNSPFIPRVWLRSTPFLTDDQVLSSQNPSRLNLEMSYELAKNATLLADVNLSISLPPVVTTGPSLQPSLYVDHIGFAIMDHFDIIFGSNQAFNLQPYDLYIRYRNFLSRERLEQVNELIYGDTTQAERTALLLNGSGTNPLITPLWLPFSDDPTQSYPMVALSQKTRFVLKTNSLANITQKSADNTLTPSGEFLFNLYINLVYTTGDEANYYLQLAQLNSGITYMIHQAVRQNSDNAASKADGYTWPVKLSGMTKALKILWFGFVPQKLLDNTGRNDMFFFKPNPPPPVPVGMTAYNPLNYYQIDSNGLIIQRQIQRNLVRLYKHQQLFPSPGGDELFFQSYTLQPMSPNTALGYLDYTNLNNPTLTVTFGAGGTGSDPDDPNLPQVLRLIVIGWDYNFWFFKGGNLARAFN